MDPKNTMFMCHLVRELTRFSDRDDPKSCPLGSSTEGFTYTATP